MQWISHKAGTKLQTESQNKLEFKTNCQIFYIVKLQEINSKLIQGYGGGGGNIFMAHSVKLEHSTVVNWAHKETATDFVGNINWETG